MNTTRATMILPILLISVGGGWLLTNLGLMPGIDWIWTISLAVTGVLFLVIGGMNKFTVTMGPLCIVGSFLSILRQNGRIGVGDEIPLLMITLGVCMLVARNPRIPVPDWVVTTESGSSTKLNG